MTYIAVYVTLEPDNHKWANRKYAPGGTIVITDDTGDALHYTYSRAKMLELCQAYYMNPECKILIDPYIVGITRTFERYAHQELGFVLGCAMSAKLKFKILYKTSYYKYFGLVTACDGAAYAYCLANYPKIQMLYKFKDALTADRACAAYLMTRFADTKAKNKMRWDADLKYIIEELDDATEDCEV